MKSEIQIEGILGSSEEQQVIINREPETSDAHITNVQTETSYPRTGEYHSSYLIFSGICLLLILLILSMKRDIKN